LQATLGKIGIVEGNGLSPFAVDMHKREDLLALFTLFCQSPPKRDPCDKGPNADGQVDVDDGNKEVTEDSEDESDAAEGGESEINEIPSNVLAEMIANLEAEDDNISDNSDEDNVDMVSEEFELTFAGGDSSKAFNEFKEMLKSGCTV
jgi:hypothetical protein